MKKSCFSAVCVFGAVMLLSGCSNDSVPGRPSSSVTSAASSTSISTAEGKQTLPPRPADLKIDAVDPCTLFPEDRRAEFGVTRPPTGPVPNGGMTGCSFFTATGGVAFFIDPAHSAAYFLGDTKDNVGLETSIGDYPAVYGYPKVRKNTVCFVEIDVADGQNLSVQYDDRRNQGPAVLCPIAEKIALMALDALKAQKK